MYFLALLLLFQFVPLEYGSYESKENEYNITENQIDQLNQLDQILKTNGQHQISLKLHGTT